LFQALDAAELDLVLAKRRPGEDRGRLVRRERLVWVAGDPALAEPERPLPLILYPPPSTSRAMALEALERAGRRWRIVCTSSSLSGLNAAALAGLGICVQADGYVLPNGLPALPPLGRPARTRPNRVRRRRQPAHLARLGKCSRNGHPRQRRSAVAMRFGPTLASADLSASVGRKSVAHSAFNRCRLTLLVKAGSHRRRTFSPRHDRGNSPA